MVLQGLSTLGRREPAAAVDAYGSAYVAAGTPAELTARDHAGLRFTAVGDLDITAAAAAVSAACGGATTTGTRGEDGGYTLIGPATPEAIAALAAWCAESGVLITELHAAGASLQDVFLSLTGREVRA